MHQRKVSGNIIIYSLLIAIILPFLFFPGYWMVVTSLKPLGDAISVPPMLIPKTVTLSAFGSLLQRTEFVRYILNSTFVSAVTVVVTVLLASFAAYAFSRFRYRLISTILLLVLLTQMLPSTLFLNPHFINMKRFGLLDTFTVLILSYSAIALPFCIWMLKSYFDTIPTEIDEAAVIDGASRLRLFFSILLPLARPSIVAVSIYSFLLSWNEFVFAMTFMSSKNMKTLPVGIAEFAGELLLKWNKVMASCVIASLPVVILFIFAQRSFVKGLTGGVKQ